MAAARSCVSLVRQVSAKPHSANPLPKRPVETSSASRSVVCAMKQTFAAIVAPTSARCPAGSSPSFAKRYLVPRQLEANGIEPKHVKFKDEALKEIIESYTREAGVRNLERNIGSVARSIAAEIVGGNKDKVTVDKPMVHKTLGPPRY